MILIFQEPMASQQTLGNKFRILAYGLIHFLVIKASLLLFLADDTWDSMFIIILKALEREQY